MTTTNHGYKQELLIGIQRDGGERDKRIQLLKSSGATEKCYENNSLAERNPIEWMARVVATMIESIGDEEVFEAFRRSKFRKLPRVMMQVPLKDLDLLWFLTHLHTYGPAYDAGNIKCPHCKRENTDVATSLEQLKLTKAKVSDIERFSVLLPTGYFREGNPKEANFLDYMNKPWNHYSFRPPTLGDAMRHKDHYTPNNTLGFNMRMFNDCLVAVESWDTDGDEAFKVAEMAADDLEMLSSDMTLFEGLDGRDRARIRGLFKKLPGVELNTEEECEHCGDMMPVATDPLDFHPLVDGD